jgi:predicted dehydrogenase
MAPDIHTCRDVTHHQHHHHQAYMNWHSTQWWMTMNSAVAASVIVDVKHLDCVRWWRWPQLGELNLFVKLAVGAHLFLVQKHRKVKAVELTHAMRNKMKSLTSVTKQFKYAKSL